jgi:hypothetical protein
MDPIAIILLFFMVLAALIGGAAFAQRKSARVLSAAGAFAWSCLMFLAAGWAQSLNYNIWYSKAASKMLSAFVAGIEDGRQAAVLREMRRMTNELHVTYESRGNFKELAERAAKSLTPSNAEPVAPHEPPPRASVSDAPDERTLDSLPAPGSSGGR